MALPGWASAAGRARSGDRPRTWLVSKSPVALQPRRDLGQQFGYGHGGKEADDRLHIFDRDDGLPAGDGGTLAPQAGTRLALRIPREQHVVVQQFPASAGWLCLVPPSLQRTCGLVALGGGRWEDGGFWEEAHGEWQLAGGGVYGRRTGRRARVTKERWFSGIRPGLRRVLQDRLLTHDATNQGCQQVRHGGEHEVVKTAADLFPEVAFAPHFAPGGLEQRTAELLCLVHQEGAWFKNARLRVPSDCAIDWAIWPPRAFSRP